jgi:peptidyl-tRNA hydrolase, PTH1 family
MDGRLQQVLRRIGRRPGAPPGRAPRPRKLVIGLGNPGAEYRDTRHNVGFRAVQALARRHRLRFEPARKQARLAIGLIGDQPVALLEPLTYMNLSGQAVAQSMRELGLTPADILVIYDDVDLPLGKLRLRPRGSAAGHKGVASIIDRIGTQEFARLRLGVGRPPDGDVREDVLTPFGTDAEATFAAVLDQAVAAAESFLAVGVDAAMNAHNR